MKNPRLTLNQTLVSAFIVVGAIVMSVSAATASAETEQASVPNTATVSQPNGVTVDLTSVVVAALTLGFGYGVLKTFQNSGNSK